MAITTDQLSRIVDSSGNVVTSDGDKIGAIGQVYLDDTTGDPNWVTVKTGLFGTSESFVPLAGASHRDGDIVVDYDKATVKNAPRVDADGSITPEEEDTLYSYYGGVGASGAGESRDYDRDVTTDTTSDVDDRARGTKGYDVSGPETDDAMALSEERVAVDTRTREAGRARLRKYVVTEDVTQTVPVQREEARSVREPITDDNRTAADSGPEISDEEHAVFPPTGHSSR